MEDDSENMDTHVYVGVGRRICTGTLMCHGRRAALNVVFQALATFLRREAVGKQGFPVAWNSWSK